MTKPENQHHIFIDKQKFDVVEDTLTGTQLRALPEPDVPADRDLYEEVPGDEDRLINDGNEVEIRNGQHFVTVPKNINPGA